MACSSWKLHDINYLEILINYSSCCWYDSWPRETSPHCKISGKIDRFILLMSGYSQNRMKICFGIRVRGGNRRLDSHQREAWAVKVTSQHMFKFWGLQKKINRDWTEKQNRKSLSVKFGSSLKFKHKNVPPEIRELYLISLSSEYWMQKKRTHYFRVYSPKPPLLCFSLPLCLNITFQHTHMPRHLFCRPGHICRGIWHGSAREMGAESPEWAAPARLSLPAPRQLTCRLPWRINCI